MKLGATPIAGASAIFSLSNRGCSVQTMKRYELTTHSAFLICGSLKDDFLPPSNIDALRGRANGLAIHVV